jgi:hypothetical protein
MEKFTTEITTWLMPDDAAEARLTLLKMAATPAEKWMILYEMSMPEMWAELGAVNRPGQIVHLYADASLAKRPAEHASLKDLKSRGADVAIGTCYAGRYFIAHSKILVVEAESKEVEAQCWEGSTNFSEASWAEANTAITFRSNQYKERVQKQWERLAGWARATEPEMQL